MKEKEFLGCKESAAVDEAVVLDNHGEYKPASPVEGGAEGSEAQHDANITDEGEQIYQGQEPKEEVGEETAEEIKSHEKNYSDEGFWKKTTKYAKKAGEKTLSPALKLYYSAKDSDTPTWAKTTIYGALGYFISPIDGIPDVTPALGYTDDIGILAGAIGVVAAHIKDEHAEQAMQTLKRWFN